MVIGYGTLYRIGRTESTMTNESTALATVTRLLDATNRCDVEGIVACFSPEYRNETPAHPRRGFTGQDQVRRNWTAILSSMPDHRAEVTATAVNGDTGWTAWRKGGPRRAGAPHEMPGVRIFTIGGDGLFAAAPFYLEPAETD